MYLSARSKLNSIENKTSKALTVTKISHKEFALTNNKI